jgi:hypothetical protein
MTRIDDYLLRSLTAAPLHASPRQLTPMTVFDLLNLLCLAIVVGAIGTIALATLL